jgi:glycosyltransferase involved in cell wall biosynthesis
VIKVTHIITGLDADGAETVLHRLTSRMDPDCFQNEVISLIEMGPMAERLRASGLRVRALNMRRGVPNPYHLLRLVRWLKDSRPNVVQTWMYHANLLGGIAARVAGKTPVIWGIHHTNLEPSQNKRLTIWTARMCARISATIPQRIVCCSEASREAHERFGYAQQKMEVIPNGFDLEEFHPNPEARSSMRKELGIAEEAPLVGMAGRFHVQKDHRNLVAAAALFHARVPGAHFVLCGKGVDRDNAELRGWIASAGLVQAFHLLGSRADMPRFFAALDVATSSSLSEAFPMALGEAMACGIPCVVTDVGDSAAIVGDTGRVVPAGDPVALAGAWRELLAKDPLARRQMGQAARNRVEQKFSLDTIVERYQELYRQVLAVSALNSVERSKLASLPG